MHNILSQHVVVRGVLFAAAVFTATAANAVPAGRTYADNAAMCAREINLQETALGIPKKLLHAISLAESGRTDTASGAHVAWPWTVMAEGRGRYYDSKQAAVAAVRSLLRRGIRNIDVGCMQINLYFHPHAFDSLDDAFDPISNVAYGARYLVALEKKRGDWLAAVKRYHSATRRFQVPYWAKVERIWQTARRRDVEVVRERRIEDVRERRIEDVRERRRTRYAARHAAILKRAEAVLAEHASRVARHLDKRRSPHIERANRVLAELPPPPKPVRVQLASLDLGPRKPEAERVAAAYRRAAAVLARAAR